MNKKAKAAVLTAKNAPFEVREYELTKPRSGYALLKLLASGVCGTDSHIRAGKLGEVREQIIGHEFIGEVVEIGEKDAEIYGIAPGDAAMVYIALTCGECILCKSGDSANCVNLGVTNGADPDLPPHFHGGFAEYTYAPVENLIKLPEDIDPVTASVFACPGPTAMHAFSLAKRAGVDVSKVSTAVVQGLGPVGCFAAAYLASLGVRNVIAIGGGRGEKKAGLVKQLANSHASEVFFAAGNSGADIIERIRELTGGLGADLVYEASGKPEAVPLGLELLRNRGVYLIPGQYSDSGGVEIQPQMITFKALHIIGSSQYDREDIAGYISFLQANKHLHGLIRSLASCYAVEDINRAFEDIAAKRNIKTVLVPRS